MDFGNGTLFVNGKTLGEIKNVSLTLAARDDPSFSSSIGGVNVTVDPYLPEGIMYLMPKSSNIEPVIFGRSQMEAVMSGLISINEARRMMGLSSLLPVEGDRLKTAETKAPEKSGQRAVDPDL
jgi:hypothetical protein